MNALCLPPALAFNAALVPVEVARFGAAIGGDAVERSRELALLGGFERLRDFGVPEDDLPEVAEAASQRAGTRPTRAPRAREGALGVGAAGGLERPRNDIAARRRKDLPTGPVNPRADITFRLRNN